MKLRKGDAIVCSKGHRLGEALADVPESEPVPTAALKIMTTADSRYVCEQCDEVVAVREGEDRWRVRTLCGWLS